MQLSSAGIALTILSQRDPSAAIAGQGATATDGVAGPQAAPILDSPGASDRYVPASGAYDPASGLYDSEYIERMVAEGKRKAELRYALGDGSRSPFDPEIADAFGFKNVWEKTLSDPRKVFPGHFVTAQEIPMGTRAPQRDADFLSRRDAMANAYHFATALVKAARDVIGSRIGIETHKDQMLDASGRLYGIGSDGRAGSGDWKAAIERGTYIILHEMGEMEKMAASLANLFSFDSTSVTQPAYDGSFQGFSITHGTLGKIMDVSADGTLTLYDAEGTAYSAEEYNAANIDGGIPQLHNDLIRQADDRAALASRGVRREASGRIVPL